MMDAFSSLSAAFGKLRIFEDKWAIWEEREGKEPAYLDVHMGHEDCKIGEMGTGACGVCPVGA